MVATAFAVEFMVNLMVVVMMAMHVLIVMVQIVTMAITATTDCVWPRHKRLDRVA